MNFSSKIKNELLNNMRGDVGESPCCRLASLSAFLLSAGSLEIRGGVAAFKAAHETPIVEYFAGAIEGLYGESPDISPERGREGRSVAFMSGETAERVLSDAEIMRREGVGFSLTISPAYLVENDCCKRAFVRGAFLGAGSVTVPPSAGDEFPARRTGTGYHLEFSFAQGASAEFFARLLTELGFGAKTIERKSEQVVYIKNSAMITDFLTYIGAVNASLDLSDLYVFNSVKNDTNRRMNCEMSNLTKQIDASLKLLESVLIIQKTVGLNSLDENLRPVAEARLKLGEETESLAEFSERLGITKACLAGRIKRINKQAKKLAENIKPIK